MKILVRAGELACRNSWGGDLFESALDAPEPAAAADLPTSGRDDEVTSVTIPSLRPPATEDRVVGDRPATRRPTADSNDAAHRDQEERARIMARGSRDALAQARQRLSTRHQSPSDPNDVAHNNIPPRNPSDRVIARQSRFSDRDGHTPERPRMATEPVPREEIAQRALTQRDRFETVPEIDPAFDLPGQSRRAAPAPRPDAHADPPEPADVPDEAELTAYEHVLQRARRIRASKQQRARPIRHADLILGRDDGSAGRHEPVDRFPESGRIDVEAYSTAFDDPEPPPHVDADNDFDPPFEDDGNDGWDDLDEGWRVDVPAAPRSRRPAWLARLGFAQRPATAAHDDAIVTRHAASLAPDIEDEVDDIEDDVWDSPRPEPAVSWQDGEYADDDLLEPHHAAWDDAARYAPEPPARVGHHPGRSQAADEWSQPAAPDRQRSHTPAKLPDLDDALFDAPGRGAAPATARHRDQRDSDVLTPARTAAEILHSRSPRDSYFRSSHFRSDGLREAAPPDPDIPGRLAPEEEATALPDIDEGQLDVRDAAARGNELIDRRISVAPGIPRRCRTCRSFRSADGGTRGWCTNEWAFTHRRMVNDDDLACASAIGCWWLPADELRLDLDDTPDDAPTPRMDKLIARNRTAARRAAGE